MELVVVENSYEPGLTIEKLAAALERNLGCYNLRRVRHLKSYVSADGSRTICLFEAPDAASVREAYEQAGGTFERVWTATAVP